MVKDTAKELNIELCYLPTYSPQLQPEEQIWKDVKRDLSQFKITEINNYQNLKKEQTETILYEIVEKSFNKHVLMKKKWEDILINYILPKINSISFNNNTNNEVQIIS